MAGKTRPIMNNFSKGEISPSLEGRIDLESYYSSLSKMENFICRPQGGLLDRRGFHFVVEVKDSEKETILIPFQFAELQNYIIEAGDIYFRFFMDCGQIITGGGVELITNGTFPANIVGWTDLSEGTGTIAWHTDHMNVAGGPLAGIGVAEQEIATVIGMEYLLNFDVAGHPIELRIGKTSGSDSILEDTTYEIGIAHAVSFHAQGTSTFIHFKNTNNNTSDLDNISMQAGTVYELLSPYLEEELRDIRWAQSDCDLYLVHPDRMPKILTRTDHDAWTITDMVFIDGPYMDENVDIKITPSHKEVGGERVTNGGFDTDTIWVKGGADWTIIGGQAVHAATGATTLSQNTGEANTEIYKVIYTLVSITPGKHVTVLIASAGGTARHTAGTYTEYIVGMGVGDLTFAPEDAATACVIDNVSVIRIITLAADAALFEEDHVGALWQIRHTTTKGCVEIESWINSTSVRAIVKIALGATTASDGQSEGCWSNVNGFPRGICFHEGRLILTSTYEQPNTIWGSRTRRYDDFTAGSLDDDSYAFTAAELNTIRWIQASRTLCIGALSGEATAVGPSDDIITPTTPPRIKSETTHGSAEIAPIRIGKAILFLQKAQKKIREFVYSYTDDAYNAPDITILSDHLVELGITKMVYQQEPNSIIWAKRSDGVLLGCTYDRSVNAVGWHRHITDGLFKDIEVIPYLNNDQLWTIIQRTIGGVNKKYIEYRDLDICVDSGLTYSGLAATVFSGLDHLIGETVRIIGDGATYADQTVSPTGTVTISPAAAEVYIGLAYLPYLMTNRPSSQATNIQGLQQGWNRIIVRVVDTMGLEVNGQVIAARSTEDLMDTAPETYTGDFNVENLGIDNEGRIEIYQRLSLPAEITMISGELSIGDE